jgi:hypothetical protein
MSLHGTWSVEGNEIADTPIEDVWDHWADDAEEEQV